jgi:hypothetical protein
MTAYRITSKAGLDAGVYFCSTPADALAAAHQDAGYDVTAESGSLIFEDEADREICGDLDAWHIEEIDHQPFLAWADRVAKDHVSREAMLAEFVMSDGYPEHYELAGQYTQSGRPEVFPK